MSGTCNVSVNRGDDRWPQFFPCGRALMPGKDKCKLHVKVEERRQQRDKEFRAESRRGEALNAEARELSEKLGVPVAAEYGHFSRRYTGNFVLPGDFVRGLA